MVALSLFMAIVIQLGMAAGRLEAQVPAGKSILVQQSWPAAGTGNFRLKIRMSESPLIPAAVSQTYFLVARNEDDSRTLVTSTKEFTLEAGDTFVDVEIYLPIRSDWNSEVAFHIERDGNFRRDRHDLFDDRISVPSIYGEAYPMLVVTSDLLQTEQEITLVTRGGKIFPQGSSSVLIDESKFPSVWAIDDLFAAAQNLNMGIGMVQTNSGKRLSSLVLSQSPMLHAIPPEDLPKSWLGLTSIRYVVMSSDDFQDVVKNNPESHRALVQWVAAGGALIISDCGSRFERAERVRNEVPSRRDRNVGRHNPWAYMNKRLSSRRNLIVESSLDYYSQGTLLSNAVVDPTIGSPSSYAKYFHQLPSDVDLGAIEKDNVPDGKVLASSRSFVFFEHLQGRVICVKDSMFNWQRRDWIGLINTIEISGRGIRKRLPTIYSENQGAFNIPDVGQPPVLAFQVLLCLFIIIIGPVAYMVLRSQQRLQLMFVVVPLVSLVACAGLLSYAFFSEGFQVRGRVRSFTEIDHPTQAAIAHVRHSHYSGAQPASYRFSVNDFVVNSVSSRASLYRERNGVQELSGGNIRSRTPHQIVSVQNFETDQRLAQLPSEEGQPPRVENRFDQTIVLALIRTEDGLYTVSGLEVGAIAIGEPIEERVARERVTDALSRLSPDIYDKYGDPSYRYDDYSYITAYSSRQDSEVEPDCDYQFEQLKRRAASMIREEGSYLAIFGELDLVAEPSPGIDYKHQVHVVRGRW